MRIAAKISRVLCFAACGMFLFASVVFAVTGAATQYEVRIKKLEMYDSSTASWVIVFSGLSSSLDIASASGSQQMVGNFLSGVTIADGVYTKCRVTPYPAFVIKGTVSGYHTTAVTQDDGNGRTTSVASNTAPAAVSCTVTILDSDVDGVGAETQDFSGTPITVKDGAPDRKIRVYFDMSNALTLTGPPAGEILYPNPPSVTVSIVDN